MVQPSLKQQTFKGIGWSSIERFSTQGVSFAVQLVLARLLTPDDYGVIGMLAIFIQLAQVIIDSGFANALIRKQNCTQRDYSTVFFYNFALSLGIYILLYLAAPFVSRFYQTPTIVPLMRWVSITLLFNALSIIPKSILVKRIDFKKQKYAPLQKSRIFLTTIQVNSKSQLASIKGIFSFGSKECNLH